MPPLRAARRRTPLAATVNSPREAAFEALFAEHWSAVHAYARRRVAQAADAHDVAAETFAVAWRRFDDIPDEHALPWLYRTAANLLSNRHRSDRRRDRLTAKLSGLPRPDAADPADVVADDEIIVDAFDSLDEDDREVLRLVAWEGLANAEVASVLGVSTNAAALRLSRARRRLADAVQTQERVAGHGMDDRHGSER